MSHFKEYLKLLNKNKIGGKRQVEMEVEAINFTHVGKKLQVPYTWNVLNNVFLRERILLKLLKLPADTIYDIISKIDGFAAEADIAYTNLLKCLLIDIQNYDNNLKNTDKIAYDTNLSTKYENLGIYGGIFNTSNNIVYIKHLIEYFMETHYLIYNQFEMANHVSANMINPLNFMDHDIMGLITPQPGSTVTTLRTPLTTKTINEHMELCIRLYTEWMQYRDCFFGIENGIKTGNGLHAKLQNDEKTINRIDEEYRKLYDESIITYIKIRADDWQKGEFNDRFNVFIEEPIDPENEEDCKRPQSLYLTGPDPNYQSSFYENFYKGFEDEQGRANSVKPGIDRIENLLGGATFKKNALGVLEVDPNTNRNIVVNPADDKLCFVKAFDYGYMYGKFTRVFRPSVTNREITNKCHEIMNTLNNNRSILMLGYGSSGAGKTSTLIYNKGLKDVNNKKGVLLELLNTPEFEAYDELEVSVHELFAVKLDEKTREPVFEKNLFDDIRFIRAGKDFVLADQTKEGTYYEKTRIKKRQSDIDAIYAKIEWDLDNAPGPNGFWADKRVNNPERYWNIGGRTYEKNLLIAERVQEIDWIDTKYKWVIRTDPNDGTYFTNEDSSNLDFNRTDNANWPISTQDENDAKDKRDAQIVTLMGANGGRILDNRMKKNKNNRADDDFPGNPGDMVKICKLEDLLLTLVDRIRMINPTTNNPVSSRSHILIYVKLPYKDIATGALDHTNHKYLIVGDLAGIENKFICSNPETQSNFLAIRNIDRATEKPIGDEPYYTRKMVKLNEFKPDDPSKIDRQLRQFLDYIGYDEKKFLFKEGEKAKLDEKKIRLNAALNMKNELFINEKNIALYKTEVPNMQALTKSSNPSDAVKNAIRDFYRNKLRSNISSPEFDYSNYSDYFKYIMVDPSNPNKAVIEKIEMNEEIKKQSTVEALCNDRLAEGVLINKALTGMSDDITNIIQNIREDRGLLKDLPLVNGTCFKFYCNQHNSGCFQSSQADSKPSDSYIFNDIRDKITKAQTDRLQIVIFGVLNADRKKNDKIVSLPYIDTNYLKALRDQYLTYNYYGFDRQPNEDANSLAKCLIDNIKEKWTCICTQHHHRQSTSFILDMFKDKLSDNYKLINDCYDKVTDMTYKHQIITNLQELINTIDNVCSPTVIGTMNYLSQVKDLFSTDITCTMLDDDIGDTNTYKHSGRSRYNIADIYDVNLFPEFDFVRFKHAITNESFEKVIHTQRKNKAITNCRSLIKLQELAIQPQTAPTSKKSSKKKVPIRFIGGGNSEFTEKQELINEYKRLKKMYKRMKSNLV